MRLVSVGNVLVDVVVGIPSLPERGGDVLGTPIGSTPGGSFNTLAAASRLGLHSAYAGGHGTGPFGDLVRAALAVEGIDVLQHADARGDTGYDLAMIDATGERTFVTVFGVEARLRSLPRPEPGDLVHVSGYGLLEATNASVVAPRVGAVGEGHVVLFDPGPLVRDIPAATLRTVSERADWISLNLREAELLGESALAEWDHVVLRLGADGCLVDGRHVPGFAVQPVDLNGAGDAHVGAFLAGLSAGLRPVDAARRANAAAALAVTRVGPATAPTAAELEAFLPS